MIFRYFLAIVGTTLLASCASEEPHHSWNYKALSAQPTPRDWKPGTIWTFVATRKSGESESFTFRVTDHITQTCSGGTWRKLKAISGHIPQLEGGASQPAYSIEGSFLDIELLAPWCDVYDQLRGRIEGDTFTGDRSQGGMTGSDVVASVSGRRVK